MKKTFKSVAFLLCGALLAGSLVGCDKENEGDNTPEKAYSLYLTNADDSNIVLNHDQEDVFYVGITTDAPVESLSVVEKNGETWCDAVVYTVDSTVSYTHLTLPTN